MNFLASTPRPAPEQAAAARARLAAGIEAEAMACGARTGRPVLGRAVLDAIRAVPRHAFVPGLPFEVAHEDEALPIGHGQTISQPFVVALMTELADLGPGDSVLEVGTGSGYQAAILWHVAGLVHSVEIVPELARAARARLAALGYDVRVHEADGRLGHPQAAPYDAILVTAAAPAIPRALVAQLREGGRIVMPVGEAHGPQALLRATRGPGDRIAIRDCLDVRFVPLLGDG